MQLSDLNLSNYILCRSFNVKHFSRSMYYDQTQKKYIKIWDNNYKFAEYFMNAYNNNFYEDIVYKFEVIKEKDKIIGYILAEGKLIDKSQIDKNKLNDLIERVVKQVRRTNIIYVDLRLQNLVEHDNKYYIIDLEPCIPIEKISEWKISLWHCFYEYRKQIKDLTLEDKEKILPMCLMTNKDAEINYGKAPGRVWLEKSYLPSLVGSVLFIGINYYTAFYHKLVQRPSLFVTLDRDEKVIEHGSPYKHYLGDIRDFDCSMQFDNVCMFGIIGHKDSAWEVVIQDTDIAECVETINKLVKPSGTLLFGPAMQTRDKEYWDKWFEGKPFNEYSLIDKKIIDINYIWWGRKK